jgi:RimJ/RimL family protein N-acetyltransferase
VFGSRWWGRGLATEAVAGMLEELRTHYHVGRVVAVFKTANARSRTLLERLHFHLSDESVDAGESALERALP